MKTTIERETVGRKYQREWYGVHFRKAGGGTEWYGASRYGSAEEAQAAIDRLGGRYENVGGITLDFGEATDLREYRIVHYVAQCEVVHTELKKV